MVPKEIRKLIERFKRALHESGFPAVRMLIFGSYARGDARLDSDVDICLVSKVFKHNKEKYRKKAVFTAFGVDPRIQVVLATPGDIKSVSLSSLFSAISKESVAA